MISHLRGRIADKSLRGVVIDLAGLGYEVLMPLSSLAELPEVGQDTMLLIHTHVREDALTLFGFRTTEERKAFRLLIGVSGVGPKLALAILSGMNIDELAVALASRDIKRLIRIPGIGKRTAERLGVELSEKFASFGPAEKPSKVQVLREELVSALVNLGYKRAQGEKVVDSLPLNLSFEDSLRRALKEIAKV